MWSNVYRVVARTLWLDWTQRHLATEYSGSDSPPRSQCRSEGSFILSLYFDFISLLFSRICFTNLGLSQFHSLPHWDTCFLSSFSLHLSFSVQDVRLSDINKALLLWLYLSLSLSVFLYLPLSLSLSLSVDISPQRNIYRTNLLIYLQSTYHLY